MSHWSAMLSHLACCSESTEIKKELILELWDLDTPHLKMQNNDALIPTPDFDKHYFKIIEALSLELSQDLEGLELRSPLQPCTSRGGSRKEGDDWSCS